MKHRAEQTPYSYEYGVEALSAEADGALCEVGGWFEIRSQVMMWSGRRPYRNLYLARFLLPPRVQIGDRVGGSN